MIQRPFWIQRLESAWAAAPIAWLAGVRRAGKTTLAESLGKGRVAYYNCDLPAVEDHVRDPQWFFQSQNKPIVVFDEIHQLHDPTRILKLGADQFPNLRILATGSSTVAATRKFRDALTGRKRVVHLVPVLWEELPSFGVSIEKRLFHGGLPQALLAPEKQAGFYREWIDSFFARDIQRLFAFRDMNRFNALFEYLLKQSGGQMERAKTAAALGIARPTVESHIRALEITHAITLVRPFHGSSRKELVKMPKIYGFDTGFVSFVRGWDPLRPSDLGPLWEHVVLEHIQAHYPDAPIRYWRDKSGREVDFVLAHTGDRVDAIECKWSIDAFDSAALEAFRKAYPSGRNLLVTPSTSTAFVKAYGDLKVEVCSPSSTPRGSSSGSGFDSKL
jgi:predicted AAA+ superfamily ATPase